MTTQNAPHTPNGHQGHWLLSAPAVAGVVYSAAWVAGLSLFALWPSNLDVTTSGVAVLAGYAGHQGVAMLQNVLVEGVAGIALAGVVLALGQAAHSRGANRLGRVVLVAGIGAAALSLIQCVLGLVLAGWVVPGHDASQAGALFHVIDRLDGVKMLALAAMGVAGAGLARRAGVPPRWLGFVGILLAVALLASGIGYLLLIPTLALAAAVSLPLLLIWVTGVGLSLGRTSRGK